MAENNRIYVGKAKYITFRNGGEKCAIWLTPEGIESINANVDNKGGINLVMVEMRDPDRAGNTHTLYVDDWKPDRGRSSGRGHAPQRREAQRGDNRDDDYDRRRNYGTRKDGGFGGQTGDNGGHRYSQEDCPRQPEPPQQEPQVPPFEDVGAPPFEDEDIPF